MHTHMHNPHTHESPCPTHTHIHDSSAKPHIHTGALARHKPHSYTHAHSCSAYLAAIGRDPDTACQCTSLPEPQAAGGEEETDGYQLFGWEPLVHSYCIATHTHTHTGKNTNSFKLFNWVHACSAPGTYSQHLTGNSDLLGYCRWEVTVEIQKELPQITAHSLMLL